MGNRITTQMLADRLRQNRQDANQVDAFVDAFFKTLSEGVTNDGVVKVKGLGTFKTIKVADRASVDVNTGERIVIPGHNKLKFVEEDKVNTLLNNSDQVPTEPAEPVMEEPAKSVKEEKQESVKEEKTSVSSKWWIWAMVALLVVLITICVVSIASNNAADKTPEPVQSETSNHSSLPANRWPQAESTTYRVHVFQKGESLTTISILYYNTPDSVSRIMQLNGLSDTTFIPLGTELRLP